MAKTYAEKYILKFKMHATRHRIPAPDLYICLAGLYSDLAEKEPTRNMGLIPS